MLKIALCEDEVLFMQDFKDRIQQFMKCKNVEAEIASFLSAEALLSSKTYYDIIFLDIKMSGINGLEAAETLRITNQKTQIIFVTSYKDYVFNAFDVSASHYLLKPVSDEKLYSALNKVCDRLLNFENDFLVLKRGGEIKKLLFDDILFCEVFNHTVIIHTRHGSENWNSKIDSLEAELNENFFRSHRSYIVNLKYVKRYDNGAAYLEGDKQVLISKRKHSDFLEALLTFHRKEVR